MTEESGVLVIACRTMAGVSPVAANSVSQQPFPTPSPFSFSVASTSWSSRPPIHVSSLVLRPLALLFSFASALSLAIPSPKKQGQQSFTEYPELIYCFVVAILTFVYSAFQLFNGICDVAPGGKLISNKISDYISFTLDQLAGYLLISSSTIAIAIIRQIDQNASLWKAAIISTSMSSATFAVIAICALLSGYKLCKRIMY